MGTRLAILVASLGVLAGMTSGVPAHSASLSFLQTHKLQISNFRFCGDTDTRPFPCDPADTAYVPDENTADPIAPVYNPLVTFQVHPGDTVVWTYRDSTGCDAISECPGHLVHFVGAASTVGFIPRGNDGATISYTIPANTPTGTLLPYYCDANRLHYGLGMTGVLQVVSS